MLSLLLTAVFAPEAPPATPTHKPSDKWVVNFADDRCLASRRFVPFANPAAPGFELVIDPRPLSDTTATLYFFVPKSERARYDATNFSVTSAEVAPRLLERTNLAVADTILFRTYLEKTQLAALVTGSIRLEGKGDAVTVPLSGYAAVRRTLDRCLDDLMVSWGFAPGLTARVVTLPTVLNGNLASLIQNEDYPHEAIRANASGEPEVLLKIDEKGRPSNCRVLRSSGHMSLDEATCAIPQRRGRFAPARDGAGQAIAAPYIYRIRWIMPVG